MKLVLLPAHRIDDAYPVKVPDTVQKVAAACAASACHGTGQTIRVKTGWLVVLSTEDWGQISDYVVGAKIQLI